MPSCIIGAVTMKMINNTSMTSTNGVTLISLIRRRSPPPAPIATLFSLPNADYGVKNCGLIGMLGAPFYSALRIPHVAFLFLQARNPGPEYRLYDNICRSRMFINSLEKLSMLLSIARSRDEKKL